MKLDSLSAQRLMVGLALTILGIAMLVLFFSGYQRIQVREQRRLLTQATVIEINAHHQLTTLNTVLQGIRERVGDHVTPANFNTYLRAVTDAMPGVLAIIVLDDKGQAVAASRPIPPGYDFSARAYFQSARRQPDADMLYIAPPMPTVSGVYAISVSRVLLTDSGAFAGVVTATLDPSYFEPLLDSVRYARDMEVVLAHWNGAAFLALPQQDSERETARLRDSELLRRHRRAADGTSLISQAAEGAYNGRMLALRTIAPPGVKVDYPLVIMTSRNRAAVYAGWRQEMTLIGSLYLALFLLSTLGLLAYQRLQRQADLRQAEAARTLEASERFLKTITDNLPAMIAYWDRDLRCRFASGTYREWFGKDPAQVVGMRLRDLLGNELFRENDAHIRGTLRGERQRFERMQVKADRSIGYTWTQYIPDIEQGEVKGFYVLASDVTPLKQIQMALEESEWRLRTIIEAEPECVAILAADSTVKQINPAGLAMLGASRAEQLAGTPLRKLVTPMHLAAFDDMMARCVQGKSGMLAFELRAMGGQQRWLECHAVPMPERDDTLAGALCVMRDITERKRSQQELERLAQTDSLTGLANRRHFMALAEPELQRAGRYDTPLSILMMDIDFFKKINDAHGHHCGDRVIQRVAELCRATLRSFDIVGRLGGEEFAVLLPETDQAHARNVAELLRTRIAQAEVRADGAAIRFTVSIGVTSRTRPKCTIESLLGEADRALYEAKHGGRNKVCVHPAPTTAHAQP